MECWVKMVLLMRRVWIGVAKRLGIRKSGGLLKLHRDVRSCEYEDVHVMWEMLNRPETELAASPSRKRKISYWKMFEWARRVPYLCRSF